MVNALTKNGKRNNTKEEAILMSSESDSDSEDEFERRVRERRDDGRRKRAKRQRWNEAQRMQERTGRRERIAKETCSFRGRKGKLKRIASFEEAQMKTLLDAS